MEATVKPKKKRSHQKKDIKVEVHHIPSTDQNFEQPLEVLTTNEPTNPKETSQTEPPTEGEPQTSSGDLVSVHAPIHLESPAEENLLLEPETELEEIVPIVQPSCPEIVSTDFLSLNQNEFIKIETNIAESLNDLSFLSLEEDEFEKLTELCLEPSEIKPFTESQLLSIYRNEELGLVNSFTETFVEAELRSGTVQQHPLYGLLLNYLRAREKQVSSLNEIDLLTKECREIQERLWILETVKITEAGECQDGNPVEASHEYQVGRFDETVFSKLSSRLARLRELVSGQHSLYTYSCQTSKLKIDDFISKICDKFSSRIAHNAPVCLSSESVPGTSELCSAISVLFYFTRQSAASDLEFKGDIQAWLTSTLALLLRLSSWSHHMFILNHVLRCPSSVIKWAVAFVQPPPAPFNCHNPASYLNHMIATLAAIVKPIKDRQNFVQETTDSREDIWVVVDSDGEDTEDSDIPPTCLRENDIISILNQMPLESLFRQMLQLVKRDERDVYLSMSSSQLLRVFALSRLLMKCLSQGMQTYSGEQSHSQFCKRLATLLTHTMLYVTDLWEAFRRDNVDCHDPCLLDRLQVEYDSIVVSGCHYLLDSRHKTVLQFLTALPFPSVSLKTIWCLFHIVMQPTKAEVLCKNVNEWWSGVEDLIPSLSEVELYYVLTAVANMALARPMDDWLFIKAVSYHLLQIGFINTSTRDNCYKISRTLLSNLTNKYPSLVSVILDKLKNCIPQAGNLSLYLFREIPLAYWVPNKEDLSLLEHWLLTCPFGSIEGSLSRYILSNMHWGLNPNNSGELFLKREVHCLTALLVVRLAILYCPETTVTSNSVAITDTIKQMSQLSSSIGRSGSEHCLSGWVWEMLFKLRLHLMDQPDPYVWATLSNPMQYFSVLPSLESLPNELSPLVRALKDKQMTAIFTALLMTSTGHSIPLICHSGFGMLLSLAQCHRYSAVLLVLQHLLPLFLDCPQALLTSEEFIQVIQCLVLADKTFFKLAKNLISSDFPGMIVKQFGDLIQIHLDTYRKYNLSSPAPLAELWLKVFTKVWSHEPNNTSYLLDIVLRTAFFRPEMRSMASEIILNLYEQTREAADLESISNSNKVRFSLSSWMLGSGSGCVSPLFPKSAPDTPWFALFALEIEEQIIHEKTGLWRQLLVDLVTSTGKTNIDSSLKKACSTLKLEAVPSSALPLYRWSQQALDTPVDHPALPIFWQKFFSIYLQRVPTPSGAKDLGCIGFKFFEGLTNHNYMKKIKKKIMDCKEFYEGKCANSSQVVAPERKEWFENIARLYNTFLFWLEETSLQDPGVYLPALPPPYKPEKLAAIFHQDQTPWHEYVDYESVRSVQRESFVRWEQAMSRKFEVPSKPTFSDPEPDPLARIIKRLQSYESPLPPPSFKPLQPVLPLPSVETLYNRHLLFDYLGNSFKSVRDFAQSHSIRGGEQSSLDCCLLELVPLLYRNVATSVSLQAACDTHTPGTRPPPLNSLNCAGPALIHLKINEIRVCATTDVAIHNNRLEMTNLIKRSCQPPPYAVSLGSALIELCVRLVEEKYGELRRIGDVPLMKSLEDVGVSLFYHLTALFTEESAQYPPLKQLITSCVEILGQRFISEDERQCPILLTTLLENPSLSPLLSSHFSPTRASPPIYLQLYRTLTNAISLGNSDQIFVLLTKFDMSQWLESQKPRTSDCSVLIELVGKALAASGQTPDQDFIMIHEVLRRQLCVLMKYDCPSHLREVLSMCLKHSESHGFSTEVWIDVINALVAPFTQLRPHLSLTESVGAMAKFATHQNTLSNHDLMEMVSTLSGHFMEERLQYGLYGLYPKYRAYIAPFASLLGLLSHALVLSVIKKHSPSNHRRVCEELWPALSGLFAPWLSPYYTKSLSQPMAAWIQQLTDDRSILSPWIAADSGHAHRVAAIFTESIRFLMDSLPESEVLSYVWQYYVATFAHPSVKEHILGVIHSNLLSLPWSKFNPSLTDLDFMLKVSDTYVPYCHTLLGSIFIDIAWPAWVTRIPDEASSKVHSSLLHLIIKLSNEPNVRQSGKIVDLLKAACEFNWHTVDYANYESAINWFVMSYDPRLILVKDSDESCDIDKLVLNLLKHAGGFISVPSGGGGKEGQQQHHLLQVTGGAPRKRQSYVRASVKLLTACFNRYKQALRTELDSLSVTIEQLLTDINTVVPLNGYSGGEGSLYCLEVLALLSGPLARTTHSTLLAWLAKHRTDCVLSKALLRTLPSAVSDPAVLGSLLEATLSAIFEDQNGGDWLAILSQLQDFVPRPTSFIETFTNDHQMLTIYAYFSKKIPALPDLDEEANILKDLASALLAMKCSPENDAKLMPLLHLGLVLGGRQADHDPRVACGQLRRLVEVAERWADYKPSWGFLGTIGIRKQPPLSNRCRVMCRMFAALVLTQFPERKGELVLDQPPFIRTTPHAPGGVTSNNVELGPDSEALRCLSLLECLTSDKSFTPDEQTEIGRALSLIRLPDNSLHNAASIFHSIASALFTERYVTRLPLPQPDV